MRTQWHGLSVGLGNDNIIAVLVLLLHRGRAKVCGAKVHAAAERLRTDLDRLVLLPGAIRLHRKQEHQSQVQCQVQATPHGHIQQAFSADDIADATEPW